MFFWVSRHSLTMLEWILDIQYKPLLQLQAAQGPLGSLSVHCGSLMNACSQHACGCLPEAHKAGLEQ